MNEELQRVDAWYAARCGKVTASRIADVVAKTKTGVSASRAAYMAQLLTERLTGKPPESGFVNAAMEWGTEQEPFARAAYSAKTGELVEEVGFIDHPTIPNSGASPDGVIADGEGLVEFKAPTSHVHLEYIFEGKPPQKYLYQMAWQMAVMGAKYCDFCSFDPRLPERYRLFIVRVQRDDKLIATLEAEVKAFLEELDQKIAKLETMQL